MGKIKDILKQENVSKTFCSKAFVWCWLTIVFVCWATGGWIAGFIMAAVAACVILCLCKDTMPVIAILWTFLFMLGKTDTICKVWRGLSRSLRLYLSAQL